MIRRGNNEKDFYNEKRSNHSIFFIIKFKSFRYFKKLKKGGNKQDIKFH